jgi:hypothetical protein
MPSVTLSWNALRIVSSDNSLPNALHLGLLRLGQKLLINRLENICTLWHLEVDGLGRELVLKHETIHLVRRPRDAQKVPTVIGASGAFRTPYL